MAKWYNPGIVDVKAAERSILANGGGRSERPNRDGTTHVTVYSREENRHFSYDVDSSGRISNFHTDKDNHAFLDYAGGR